MLHNTTLQASPKHTLLGRHEFSVGAKGNLKHISSYHPIFDDKEIIIKYFQDRMEISELTLDWGAKTHKVFKGTATTS